MVERDENAKKAAVKSADAAASAQAPDKGNAAAKSAKTPVVKVAKESAPAAKVSGGAKSVAIKRRATGK